MKKTLIILFTLFISAAAVFSVFASETLNEGENSSVFTTEAIKEEESTKDIIDAAAKSEPTQSLIAETETAQPESPSESFSYGSISSDAEKAKKSAALYAAADYEDVRFFRCEYDIEGLKEVYEIEFCSNGTEYECEVDADSFEVIKCEKEPCDNFCAENCMYDEDCSEQCRRYDEGVKHHSYNNNECDSVPNRHHNGDSHKSRHCR